MIVFGTGHRPNMILDVNELYYATSEWLTDNRPQLVYQGMAAGFDLILARAAHEVGIPFVSVKPFAGHRNGIPADWEEHYDKAWEYAAARVTLNHSENYPGPKVFHARNEYMVNRSDYGLCYWNGSLIGGTTACLRYAKKKNLDVTNLYPNNKFSGIIPL